MTSRFLFTLALALAASGCMAKKGFHRESLRTELNDKIEVTDAEIAKALTLKPQLPLPFTVGVYFKEPEAAYRYGAPAWHWTDEDKEKILRTAEKLKEGGQVSKVFVISPSVVSGQDLKSIRLAAAQHGADALLVVSGAQDLDSYHNSWSWTYIAVVTALFVPANQVDALFLSRAALWDVRNQFLYMTAEAESTKSQTRPAASIDERKALSEAKQESLDKLSAEIARMAEEISRKKQEVPVSPERQAETTPRIFKSKILNKSTQMPISM